VFTLHAIDQSPLGQDPIHRFDEDGHHRCRYHRYICRCRYDVYDRIHSTSLTSIQFALGWITVTQVCRHWRQVALSNPTLWVNIVFDLGVEWAEEMLERSKAAPISYYRSPGLHKVHKRKAFSDPETLYEHLSHIQRLEIFGGSNLLFPAVCALTRPAPHLESLELVLAGPNSISFLPSGLFSLQVPRLRHLNIRGFTFPWDSFPLCDLTHLVIRVPRSCASAVDENGSALPPSSGFHQPCCSFTMSDKAHSGRIAIPGYCHLNAGFFTRISLIVLVFSRSRPYE